MDNPRNGSLKQEKGRLAAGEFVSLAEAQAWLAALRETIGSAARAELAEIFMLLERAYDQFPELAVTFPRGALFRYFRAVAAALPDIAALPLLLLCAAAEPSDSASLADLFERAARSDSGASLHSVLQLFRQYVDLGWKELGPAVVALIERRAEAGVILGIASEILKRNERPPEGTAELSRALAPLLFGDRTTAIAAAGLVQTAAAARRRLAAAAAGDSDAVQRQRLLMLAERLRMWLRPPARPSGDARLGWPHGETGFPSFVAQWPDLAIEVPARQLCTSYAVLGADGVLRAERHTGEAFCHGPYLNLPAGRYRIRIIGEAGADAEYIVQIVKYWENGWSAIICTDKYVQSSTIFGIIADLVFSSDDEMHDLEVVVKVLNTEVEFSVGSIKICTDHLRRDLP
ncbi:MAG TPA: hypothetical protein VE993_00795 [Stellaceae bacterium]|nr:hypothetical protein [Stellaceae bacterium]